MVDRKSSAYRRLKQKLITQGQGAEGIVEKYIELEDRIKAQNLRHTADKKKRKSAMSKKVK